MINNKVDSEIKLSDLLLPFVSLIGLGSVGTMFIMFMLLGVFEFLSNF